MICALVLIADVYINPCQVVYITPKADKCLIVTTRENLEFSRRCEEIAEAMEK